MRGAAAVILLLSAVAVYGQGRLNTDPKEARAFLDEFNEAAMKRLFQSTVAAWNYNTNLTDDNQKIMNEERVIDSDFSKQAGLNASRFDWKGFKDTYPDIYRQFSKISDIGRAALENCAKVTQYTNILSTMERTYGEGKVCWDGNKDCLSLEPGLTRLLRSSTDYNELVWAWKGWRDAVGREVGKSYPKYTTLANEVAKANGWKDNGDYWRSWYETPTLRDDVEGLWEQVKPLYRQLHAFVRRYLRNKYGDDKFPKDGHIPAHLFGDMWAQSWGALNNDLRPYKDKESVDVTPQMVEQGYDAKKMFEVSDEFFQSLGLIKMPERFWNYSMITKPKGREVVCHASAWDFKNQKDFRIKQCTDVTMDDLITVHHEMGHIEYYLQCKNLPVVYRGGANPGFHEAVGDVLALSVATPDHLKKIKLLDEVEDDTESDINFLLSMALNKIAFLPFGYLMDQWRWGVFDGTTPKEKYNEDWWKLRCKYQGIFPPVKRETGDFDPGAKYHIPGNTPYIRYFVSFVIQFQFHKALCRDAGQGAKPLYKCDIYNSKVAGKKLGDMLALGSSKKWPEAMKMVTGSTTMDAGPLLEYFELLYEWLETENSQYSDDNVGWNETMCPDFVPPMDTSAGDVAKPALLAVLCCLVAAFWRS